MSGVILCCSMHQAFRGAPWLGSYSLVWRISHLNEHPGWVLLCSSVHHVFDGPASLLFSCQCWCLGRERLWYWPHPLCVTRQYRLASVAAWLSSTGISHHNLLPHLPVICLYSQQQPSPWDCSTIPKLQLPATMPPRRPGVRMAAARTACFSFHLGCH